MKLWAMWCMAVLFIIEDWDTNVGSQGIWYNRQFGIGVQNEVPGGGHGNPLQRSCLENPMDWGAWQTIFHTVTKIQTKLKQLGMNTQNEAQKRLTVLSREHTGHSKHPLPTTKEATLHVDITRWSIPQSGSLYFVQPNLEKLYTESKRIRSWAPYCKIQA